MSRAGDGGRKPSKTGRGIYLSCLAEVRSDNEHSKWISRSVGLRESEAERTEERTDSGEQARGGGGRRLCNRPFPEHFSIFLYIIVDKFFWFCFCLVLLLFVFLVTNVSAGAGVSFASEVCSLSVGMDN